MCFVYLLLSYGRLIDIILLHTILLEFCLPRALGRLNFNPFNYSRMKPKRFLNTLLRCDCATINRGLVSQHSSTQW